MKKNIQTPTQVEYKVFLKNLSDKLETTLDLRKKPRCDEEARFVQMSIGIPLIHFECFFDIKKHILGVEIHVESSNIEANTIVIDLFEEYSKSFEESNKMTLETPNRGKGWKQIGVQIAYEQLDDKLTERALNSMVALYKFYMRIIDVKEVQIRAILQDTKDQ